MHIHYELIDNGGASSMYLPIILPVDTIFDHEYGTYQVKQHVKKMAVNGKALTKLGIKKYKNELVILCDRIK